MIRLWRVAVVAALLSSAIEVGPAVAADLLDALAANNLVSSGKLTLIDVRSSSERSAHGIPEGSIWIEWHGMEQARSFIEALKAAQPDMSAPVAFICSVGHRSGQTARLAEREGYRKVFDVAEGINGSTVGPGWRMWGLAMQP